MKCEIITYEQADNGLALFVVPETDAERSILQGLWKHGELTLCNGVADRSPQGFAVRWKTTEQKARDK